MQLTDLTIQIMAEYYKISPEAMRDHLKGYDAVRLLKAVDYVKDRIERSKDNGSVSKGARTMDKVKVLGMIATDMKNDAENFDGQPFNGKTVAEYFGHQGAAIAALANIIKSVIIDAKDGE